MSATMTRTSKRPARRRPTATAKRRTAPAKRTLPYVTPDSVNAFLRSQRQPLAQMADYGGEDPQCARSGFSAGYASDAFRTVRVDYFSKGEQGAATAPEKAAKRTRIKQAAKLLRSAGLAPKVSASGYRVSVKAVR